MYAGPALDEAGVEAGSGAGSSGRVSGRVIRLSRELPYTHVLNEAAFVIGKFGYSTLSECAAYEKPFVAAWRHGYPEDEEMAKVAGRHVRLMAVAPEVMRGFGFGGELRRFLREGGEVAYRLRRDGARFIADAVEHDFFALGADRQHDQQDSVRA